MPITLAAFAALWFGVASTTPVEAARAAARAQDPDDHVRRWYDLRAIISTSVTVETLIDLRLHLESAWIDALEPDFYDIPTGPEQILHMHESLEAIAAAVDAAPQADVADLTLHAGRLLVVGNEAAQDTVERAIEALHSAVSDTVSIELYRLDGDRIPLTTSAVLGAGAASELIARLGDSPVAVETLRTGRRARLGDSAVTTFLADYDVEVAQYMKAADPVVSVLATGIEVGVRVDRAADGRRFIIRTWGRDGAIDGPIRVLRLDAIGGAKIELPRVSTSLWTASAIVEPGGALVIDHDGGGRSALILRIPASGVTVTPHALIPLGELSLPPMRPMVHELSAATPSGGAPRLENKGEFEFVQWDDDYTLASLVEDALDNILANGVARMFGSALLLSAPETDTREAREAVDALQMELAIGTITVDVRYGYVAPRDVGPVLNEGGAAAFAETATGRLLGAVIENDALLLVGGTESAYLQDHDIQIAAGVMVPDPIVAGFFEGIAIWCAPVRLGNDGVIAWFDVQAQASDGTPRGIKTSIFVPSAGVQGDAARTLGTFEETLAIELPVTHRATARTLVESRDGEWTLVMARQLPGTERMLVVVARMNVR